MAPVSLALQKCRFGIGDVFEDCAALKSHRLQKALAFLRDGAGIDVRVPVDGRPHFVEGQRNARDQAVARPRGPAIDRGRFTVLRHQQLQVGIAGIKCPRDELRASLLC